jgi:hypothetical protein
MEWVKYRKGHLARYNHGFYFIEQTFDRAKGTNRWFVRFDTVSSGKPKLSGSLEGYEHLIEAQAHCEQAARDLEDRPSDQPD